MGDGVSSKRMGKRYVVRKNEEGRGGGVTRERNSVTHRWARWDKGARTPLWCCLLRSGGSHSPVSRHMGAWFVGGSASTYFSCVFCLLQSCLCQHGGRKFSHRPSTWSLQMLKCRLRPWRVQGCAFKYWWHRLHFLLGSLLLPSVPLPWVSVCV